MDIDINTFETAFSNWNKARGGDGRHTQGFIDWSWDYLESTLYTLEDPDDRTGREQTVYEMVYMLEMVKGEKEEWFSAEQRKEAISAAWAYLNAYDEQIVDEIRKELEDA